MLSSMQLGVVTTALLCRVFCVSVLTFVMQFSEIPEHVLQVEEDMLRVLVPGPGKWLPEGCVFNMPEIFCLPIHSLDIPPKIDGYPKQLPLKLFYSLEIFGEDTLLLHQVPSQY